MKKTLTVVLTFILLLILTIGCSKEPRTPEPFTGGILSCNAVNTGLMVQKDGDPYYYICCLPDIRSGKQVGIFRVNSETNERTLIMPMDLAVPEKRMNLYKDWIYFYNDGVQRVKTDGSVHEQVVSRAVRYYQIVGDTMYYIVNGSLYASEISNEPAESPNIKEKGDLVLSNLVTFYIEDEWIYFCRTATDDKGGLIGYIYRCDLQGKRETLLMDTFVSQRFTVDHGVVYLCNGIADPHCLYRSSESGKSVQISSPALTQITDYSCIYNGYVYFLYADGDAAEQQLARCDLEGGNLQILDKTPVSQRNRDVRIFITSGFVSLYDTKAGDIFLRVKIPA